jgi:hypothetical protein
VGGIRDTFGDSTENGARQSRAPLRALARTRAPAERPVFLTTNSRGDDPNALASVEKYRFGPIQFDSFFVSAVRHADEQLSGSWNKTIEWLDFTGSLSRRGV